jgi:hypothetical protein
MSMLFEACAFQMAAGERLSECKPMSPPNNEVSRRSWTPQVSFFCTQYSSVRFFREMKN